MEIATIIIAMKAITESKIIFVYKHLYAAVFIITLITQIIEVLRLKNSIL